MKKNVIAGIVNICLGGYFLLASGSNLIAWYAFKNDFQLGPPVDEILWSSVMATVILGTILTSIGLFLFLYGMKKAASKPAV